MFFLRIQLNQKKHELTKVQRKKNNFINRLKNAELKIFGKCVDVYKTFECDKFDKIYEVLSNLKNKKLKIKTISYSKNIKIC